MGWCADAIYAGVAYQYVDTGQGWPDIREFPQNQCGPIASTQAFLAVCAARGYGIQFDP